MSLPDQLLLSDLLSRRVRCDQGLDHGPGQLGWMHPPVHRLLGWASRPSLVSSRRCMWRLDQLRGLGEGELFVRGAPADTDAETLLRLPTLLGAALLSAERQPLGQLADAAVDLRTGRILHYLVARSDPRLPGGSRWRLSPERIVDQRPGEVFTALRGLEDLPLAHASLRETLLRRSRRWREQWSEESSRWRDQFEEVSGRMEQKLEGWLEEPPWEEPQQTRPRRPLGEDIWEEAGEDQKRGDHDNRDDAWQRSEPRGGRGDDDRWDPPSVDRREQRRERRYGEDADAELYPGQRRRRKPFQQSVEDHDDPWI